MQQFEAVQPIAQVTEVTLPQVSERQEQEEGQVAEQQLSLIAGSNPTFASWVATMTGADS
jgi:hypothetical protein